MSGTAIRAGRAFVELFVNNAQLTQGLKLSEQQLKEFGTKTSAMGQSLMKAGAIAAAPAAISTKIFAGFDDQMRAVQGVTGSTGKEFDLLTEKAKLLGRTTSFTAAQVASGMLELGRAGFKSNEIDSAIAGVMNLSRATQTEIPLATEIAGNALRGFCLDADQMGRVSDVLAATANNSSQTLEDLGEAFKYVAPIADAAGMSLEDTAKSLGTLANFGIKGSMAGTAVKNILTRMANPSIQQKYQNLGVAVKDAGGNLRNMADVLQDVGKATANLPNAERLAIFKKLFDMRAMASGAKLSASTFDSLNAAIDNAAGEAERVAKMMDEGIGGAFRMFLSAAEGVAIAIGTAVAPEIQRLTEYITTQTTALVGWVTENKETILSFMSMAAKLAAVGAAVYALGKSILSLITIVNGVCSAAKALSAASNFLIANPYVLVIAGITAAVIALGDAFERSGKYAAQLSDNMQKLEASNNEERKKDQIKFQGVEKLAKKSKSGSLDQKEFTEGVRWIAELENKYGNLGLAVDEVNKKIVAATDNQKKFLDAMHQQALRDKDSTIAEEERNLEELKKQEAAAFERTQGFGGFLRQEANGLKQAFTLGAADSAEESWAKEIDEAGNAVIEKKKEINRLKKEREAMAAGDASVTGGGTAENLQAKVDNIEVPEVPEERVITEDEIANASIDTTQEYFDQLDKTVFDKEHALSEAKLSGNTDQIAEAQTALDEAKKERDDTLRSHYEKQYKESEDAMNLAVGDYNLAWNAGDVEKLGQAKSAYGKAKSSNEEARRYIAEDDQRKLDILAAEEERQKEEQAAAAEKAKAEAEEANKPTALETAYTNRAEKESALSEAVAIGDAGRIEQAQSELDEADYNLKQEDYRVALAAAQDADTNFSEAQNAYEEAQSPEEKAEAKKQLKEAKAQRRDALARLASFDSGGAIQQASPDYGGGDTGKEGEEQKVSVKNNSTGTFNAFEVLGQSYDWQRSNGEKQLSALTDIKSLIEERDPAYI